MKDWEKDLIGRMIFALIAGTSVGIGRMIFALIAGTSVGVIIILVARAAKYLFG